MDGQSSLPYKLFRGYKIPKGGSEEYFRKAADFRPNEGCVFIVSYPKCGTTWLQSIVYHLLFTEKSRAITGIGDIFKGIPFPEQDGFPENVRFRALKYHLPLRLMKPLAAHGQYLYIARNPKDACVSTYHFLKNLPGYEIESFDHFFDAFLSGEFPYGDIMDHILEWYEARHEPNVLFLNYESLHSDRKESITTIARFLKRTLSEKQLEEILEYTSFEYMRDLAEKDNFMRSYLEKSTGGHHLKAEKDDSKQPKMMRRGIVGDWKNHLTEDQNLRMNNYIRRKAEGTSLLEIWKNHIDL